MLSDIVAMCLGCVCNLGFTSQRRSHAFSNHEAQIQATLSLRCRLCSRCLSTKATASLIPWYSWTVSSENRFTLVCFNRLVSLPSNRGWFAVVVRGAQRRRRFHWHPELASL